MTRLLLLVFAALMMGTSQASTQLTQSRHSLKPLVGKTATATRNASARVLPRKHRVLNNQLAYNHRYEDNDDPAGPDELDLQSPYRRPRIVEHQHDTDVSDYVAVRLAVARARSLAKYREIHT